MRPLSSRWRTVFEGNTVLHLLDRTEVLHQGRDEWHLGVGLRLQAWRTYIGPSGEKLSEPEHQWRIFASPFCGDVITLAKGVAKSLAAAQRAAEEEARRIFGHVMTILEERDG